MLLKSMFCDDLHAINIKITVKVQMCFLIQ